MDSTDPRSPPPLPVEPIAYATPVAFAGQSPDGPLVMRKGSLIIVPNNVSLPPRCVYCNEPAKLPLLRRKFYWHTPWIYILVVPGILIYALVALCVRKSGTTYVGLCPRHVSARRKRIAVASIIVLIGIAGLIASIAASVNSRSDGAFLPLMVLLSFIGIIVGAILVVTSRVLTPRYIDRQVMHLKGAGPAFLNSIEYSY